MKERVIKIFIFGLNQVGKTTIVEYFRERKFIPQSPTIGVSISRLIFSRLVLDITDVGGQELFRREWTSYLKKPHVLMFVIDGTDRITSRIRQGRQELDRILGIPRISGVPLLVLINKSDAALSMSKRAAMDKYQLQSIKDRQVAIYEVSAKTGVNMDAALNALTSMVLKDDAIEYFVNEEVRKQSRRLLTSFNEFMKKGTSAFKKKEYFEAIASLNIAKELYSNLFQLGVVESGKSYQKLVSMIAEAERESSSMTEDEVLAGKAPVGAEVAGDTGGGKGRKQSWLE
ncbi:GTP-binding protein, partial [Candidatus Bathyarchaeota archaeon]|nr:GTP-binding protein [Candidatus Bathyarchaeota archaeon]